ncbi:MAG: MATE family efflux transporter [Bacillota bacterium]|jgi:putative MATE family efflux protein
MHASSTTKTIIKFALPLMASSLLQQLYNAVDSLIVGRICGETSMAAIGAANPIMNLLVFFLYGIGIGITVLLSNKLGHGDKELYRRTASSALCGGMIFTVIISLFCIIFAKGILQLTQAPDEIIPQSYNYLIPVFIGLIFTFLYNYSSSALLSLGLSKIPLYALMMSSVIHIGLDLLFVGSLSWGTLGAGISTAFSQGISALICMIYLYKTQPLLAFKPRELVIDKKCLKELIPYSSASAVQQTFLYAGKLLIQGAVNGFGVSVIAGYDAATKIEAFVLAPGDGVSSSASALCAKNMGANDKKMIKTTMKVGTSITICYDFLICVVLFTLAPKLVPLFISDISATALATGVTYLRVMAFLYFFAGINQMYQGYFRGIGKPKVTIISTVLSMTTRVGSTYLLVGKMGIIAVCLGSLLGWFAMIGNGEFFRRKFNRTIFAEDTKNNNNT